MNLKWAFWGVVVLCILILAFWPGPDVDDCEDEFPCPLPRPSGDDDDI